MSLFRTSTTTTPPESLIPKSLRTMQRSSVGVAPSAGYGEKKSLFEKIWIASPM